MPEAILGLPTYQKFLDNGDVRKSHRRRILHSYPNGGSPLTGILSMMKTEPVDAMEHIWYEKRYTQPRTNFRGTNPMTETAPTDGDSDDGTNLSTGSKNTTADIWVKVASTHRLAPGQIVRLNKNDIQLRIVGVTRGVATADEKGFFKARPVRTFSHANDDDGGGEIEVIGTAHGEGALGGSVNPTSFRTPISVMNTTQIWRDAFTFPGTVLKQGMEWDKSGPYKEKAHDTVIDHMVNLENSVVFGKRSSIVRPSLEAGGEDEVVRTMSGILEYMRLWDAGDAGLTIDGTTYAPYSHKGQSTSDQDDGKRIIDNSDGVISVDNWNVWAERIGRYHTNKTNEKLALCGSTALNTMHKLFRRETSFNVETNQKAYGLNFTTLHTPYGPFHFLMHPLLNENPHTRSWVLILDVWSFRFRPLRDRDTTLLKHRQNPGDDRRKDEFLTEATLEAWNIENNMLIKNVTDYSAS